MADRTKVWIADAMRKLMKIKSIDKIRVTEICKEAEIERPTFYYHFQDKYDLVAWMFFQMASDISVIHPEESARALNSMKQDYNFYKRAYENCSQNALVTYMLEHFVKRYEELAKELTKTDELDPQIVFFIRMYCYGCVGMSREWFLAEESVPAETLVQWMFRSMPEPLRIIFFPKGQ